MNTYEATIICHKDNELANDNFYIIEPKHSDYNMIKSGKRYKLTITEI